MCMRYKVKGRNLTLKEVLFRLEETTQVSRQIKYSEQEIESAAKVLDRLVQRRETREVALQA